MRENKNGKITYTREDLVYYLYDNIEFIRKKTQAEQIVREVILFFQENFIENNKIEIKGFGVFEVKYFKERKGKIPIRKFNVIETEKGRKTEFFYRQKNILKKGHLRVHFKESSRLRKILNKDMI